MPGHRDDSRPLVLLVEDEPTVQRLIGHILEPLGYESVATGSFEEALAVWAERREEIAGVMVDWSLPDGTGGDLVESLRAEAPALPVVLMSGDSHHWERWLDRADPRMSYLPKPFTIEDVSRALERVLA